MPFYFFRQNNSGGRFKLPAIKVIIEADDYEEANFRALDCGLYFGGVSTERDCACCGDRWYRADESDGDDVPSVYSTPVMEYLLPTDEETDQVFWGEEEGVPEIAVYFKDGTRENYFVLSD